MHKINAKNKCVLIIPDLHIPFEHRDALKFLTAVADKYKPEIIINLGDEIDGKSLNFHDKSPQDLFTPCKELEISIKKISKFKNLFPNVHLCESNHGSLIYRRAEKFGIPYHALKSYAEILETPTWYWHEDIVLDTAIGPVYLCHGKTSSYGKLAKEMGMHACQGHFHSKFEITWHKSIMADRYNLFSGCLINYNDLAFNYGKNHLPKPILGCTIITSTGIPELIKM